MTRLTWQSPSSQCVTWQMSVHAIGWQVSHVTQQSTTHLHVCWIRPARITWCKQDNTNQINNLV